MADASPRTIVAVSAPPNSLRRADPRHDPRRRGRYERGGRLECRRTLKHHQAVGGVVEPGRGRQVDDLEVRRDRLEQAQGACRPGVVEGHEWIVEHERWPAIPGDQPDEAEASHEVDEVDRPLAQGRHRDPVVLGRRMDLDVERLVIDPDPTVATTGGGRKVADHVRFEVAGDRLHGRLFGPVDGREGRLEDALAALESSQLLAPGDQSFGVTGDLLGVDRVGLDPRAGVGFIVAGALQGRLLVAHLDLQALPGARFLGDRSERIERARLLRDLEGGRVALR